MDNLGSGKTGSSPLFHFFQFVKTMIKDMLVAELAGVIFTH